MSQVTQEDVVIARIKKAILSRGGTTAFRDAVRAFRVMDINDDNTLDPKEFENGIKRIGVKVTPHELQYMLRAFDKNKDGRVSVDEFVSVLIGGLNPRRQVVVERAFKKFDKTGDGVITLDDIRGTYNAKENPLVLKGEKTEEEVLQDFLRQFDDEAHPNGTVTKEEFLAYYSGISASIPHDDFFEALVLKAWNLDQPEKPRLDSTQRLWGPAGDPLDTKGKTFLATDPLNNYGVTAKTYNAEHIVAKPAAVKPNPYLQRDYVTTMKRDFPNYDGSQIVNANPLNSTFPIKEKKEGYMTGNEVIDGVRKRILQRVGEDGFAGVQRTFRIMDKNRSYKLEKQEIRDGMQRIGVRLTDLELDTIVRYFDRDGSGVLDMTELLRGLRGPMTAKCRVDIVNVAFERLDTDKSGHISMSELAAKYDTSKHPKVLRGTMTEEEVLREFIGDWDKDGDDVVTHDEWMEYYSNISAGIDSDSYFELMVRNAWHISGGTGQRANTSCRRVLVVFNDDTQRVLEIKDDLGIRSDDITAMKKNLEGQGFTGIKKIELYH